MSNIFEVMLKKNIGDFTYEEKRELNNWLIENLKLKELIYSGLELTKVINEDGEETAYYENKITEEDNKIVLFALINGDRVNLVFSCSKNLNSLDMNSLLKDAIKLIDGNGGGSKFNAQGGGKNNSNLESLD